MNVLVTDAESRAALAVTRSLGSSGHRVFVTANKIRSIASCSRYCYRGFSVPDPMSNDYSYVEAISEIVKKEGIDVIFPITEQSILRLNSFKEHLSESTILACPPEQKISAVTDKFSLFKLAESLDVAIPKTFYLENSQDLGSTIENIEKYPVVVKPSVSKVLKDDHFISTRVQYANSPDELIKLYSTDSVLSYPSMIQEKIIGPGTGLFTLFDHDQHLALFSHRRLREKPPSGGVSVVSESVPLDPEMVESSRRLLSAIGWNNVAMVEFKRDLSDGRAKLMEINGRFWGSLQLAIACGVDFPVLLLDLLEGKRPSSQLDGYKLGHKMKWFFGTLDHLFIRLKNSDSRLNLPPGHPTKAQAVFDFLRIFENKSTFDVFDLQDLRPFMHEAFSYLSIGKD